MDHDPQSAVLQPEGRLTIGDRMQTPRADPSAVAIDSILDPDPLPRPVAGDTANHLTEQQLAAQLGAMVREATQVECSDVHDRLLPLRFRIASLHHHSPIGLISV